MLQRSKYKALRITHSPGNQTEIPLYISESQRQDSNPKGYLFRDVCFILVPWLWQRKLSYTLHLPPPIMNSSYKYQTNSCSQINSSQKQTPKHLKETAPRGQTPQTILELCWTSKMQGYAKLRVQKGAETNLPPSPPHSCPQDPYFSQKFSQTANSLGALKVKTKTTFSMELVHERCYSYLCGGWFCNDSKGKG